MHSIKLSSIENIKKNKCSAKDNIEIYGNIETVFFLLSRNKSVNDYDMLGQTLKIENLLRA